MTTKIIKYIEEQINNSELEEALDANDDLLGGGILDSLGMMKLVLFIETEFNIKVPPQDMIIENFMTVDHICEYIREK